MTVYVIIFIEINKIFTVIKKLISSEVRFSLADQHVFNGVQSGEYRERMRLFLSSTKRVPVDAR